MKKIPTQNESFYSISHESSSFSGKNIQFKTENMVNTLGLCALAQLQQFMGGTVRIIQATFTRQHL